MLTAVPLLHPLGPLAALVWLLECLPLRPRGQGCRLADHLPPPAARERCLHPRLTGTILRLPRPRWPRAVVPRRSAPAREEPALQARRAPRKGRGPHNHLAAQSLVVPRKGRGLPPPLPAPPLAAPRKGRVREVRRAPRRGSRHVLVVVMCASSAARMSSFSPTMCGHALSAASRTRTEQGSTRLVLAHALRVRHAVASLRAATQPATAGSPLNTVECADLAATSTELELRRETFAFSSYLLYLLDARGETLATSVFLLIPLFRNLHRTWKINLCYSLSMTYHCKNAVREDMPMIESLSIYFHFICFYFSVLYYLDAASCTPSSCSSTPTSSTRPFATTSL